MITFLVLYLWGQNVVFNPGFDMTPWDTGWTVDTATFEWGTANAGVFWGPDSGLSFPNCCSLKTYAAAGPGEARAEGSIYQFFPNVKNVIFKAHVKYMLGWYMALYRVQLYMNDQWKTIWEESVSYGFNERPNWTEICTTVTDTVSGIRVYAYSDAYASSSSQVGNTWLWIDDIYVGEVAVYENETVGGNLELSVYPNPFAHYALINSISNQTEVKIYNVMGKLVEETNRKTIGKNLPAGVYFVKVKGCKPAKIIKLL